MANIVQVGLGRWGFDWARDVVPSVATAEAVAYVDSSPAALERVQSELRIDRSHCFTSLKAALEAVRCDLVLATLRTDAHFPVVGEALEAGQNVIVEKPFALTVAEAKALVALADQRKRVLMVSQNYRHFPAPIAAAELVANRALGRVDLVSLDFRNHAPTIGYRYWDMPDPLIADMSIHHFDLMRMVLNDDALRVSCRTWNPPGSPFAHDPSGVLTIEFAGGTMVSYRGSWMSGGAPTPWSGEWVMDCTEGEIVWTSRDTLTGALQPDQLTVRRRGQAAVRPALPVLAYHGRAGALAAAIRAIAGDVPPRFSSGRDNLHSLALVEASILSSRQDGDWVAIAEVLG